MDKKKLAVGAAVAVMLTLGGGAAIAAQNPAETTGVESAGQEEQGSSVKGTIAAPAEEGAENETVEGKEGQENETAEHQQEAAETRRLEGLAKVDRAAAEKAALDAAPGTVKDAELGDENGFVVWEVEVQGSDGTRQEVLVDAGNGQILAREAEND